MAYKILYVEDEKILGQLVTEALTKKGYEVMHIANGVAAFAAFRQMKPHLCLLDIMLPGKDGYEIARQIRGINKKTPILFLTAKIQVADLVTGFEAGCNDYIRKPFSIDELYLRIAGWLAEKYGQEETLPITECSIDGYLFHPQKQTLQPPDGSATIQLTHKEALLLQLLYTHRNNIISRDYLLQKIWSNDTIHNSRTLDVYINKLRKYLGEGQNKIITLKSIGYRFICD